MSIYLDYNSSTPIDERVLEAMIVAYQKYFGNADSRTHNHGQNARREVEKARGQVASLLGVQTNEIIFTSGATESDNLAVLGLKEHGLSSGRRHILTTSIEHKAILESVKHLARQGFNIEFVNPDESGRVDASIFLERIRPDTLLASVQHVNNETGIIQPVKEIGEALAATDTLFHIDAVQSCGKLVDEIKALRYDLLSLSAHKMLGPQGVGALIMRRKKNKRLPVRPIVFGGGHEGGMRSGTLPVALIIGLGKACEIAQQEYINSCEAYQSNKRLVINELDASGVHYEINGNPSYCMNNTLNVSFVGVDSEALMITTKDYCSVSNGSACTSKDYSPSYVLTAMGFPDERVESAIRLSWGTTPIDNVLVRQMFAFIKSQQ